MSKKIRVTTSPNGHDFTYYDVEPTFTLAQLRAKLPSQQYHFLDRFEVLLEPKWKKMTKRLDDWTKPIKDLGIDLNEAIYYKYLRNNEIATTPYVAEERKKKDCDYSLSFHINILNYS